MKLIFAGKQPAGDDAVAFSFMPAEPLSWVAGQSIKIELPTGYDAEERRFTIAAPPLESRVVITTRLNPGEFKQALDALVPGQEITAYNIDGTFTWRDNTLPHLFVANGVGITPYIAMLRQRHLEKTALSATLLYANARDRFVHEDTLHNLTREHPELHVLFFPARYVTAQDIMEHWQPEQFLYLSGATHWVDEIGQQLLARGVPPELLLRDWFNGRPHWDEQ